MGMIAPAGPFPRAQALSFHPEESKTNLWRRITGCPSGQRADWLAGRLRVCVGALKARVPRGRGRETTSIGASSFSTVLSIANENLANHGPNDKKRHTDRGVNHMHRHRGTLGSCVAKRIRASYAIRLCK